MNEILTKIKKTVAFQFCSFLREDTCFQVEGLLYNKTTQSCSIKGTSHSFQSFFLILYINVIAHLRFCKGEIEMVVALLCRVFLMILTKPTRWSCTCVVHINAVLNAQHLGLCVIGNSSSSSPWWLCVVYCGYAVNEYYQIK